MEPGLLARYLAGECSGKERREVEQWMAEQPRNRAAMETYRHLWGTASVRDSLRGVDAAADWQTLQRKLDETPGSKEGRSGQRRAYEQPSHSHWPAVARVAAIFVVASLIGFFAYQQWSLQPADSPSPSLREISTQMGQRVNLTLADGTEVLLNAGSTLKLPPVFDSDRREVILEGQAYFEVAENPDKPFVIYSGHTSTRVLGTAFSVRSYPDDASVTVAVRRGKVAFASDSPGRGTPAILGANELGRYHRGSGLLDTQPIQDMELYLGWVDGYLKFREAPMAEVAADLQRRYGVRVRFGSPGIADKKLTALLKGRSIRNVLDVISLTLDVNYRMEDEHVIFTEP